MSDEPTHQCRSCGNVYHAPDSMTGQSFALAPLSAGKPPWWRFWNRQWEHTCIYSPGAGAALRNTKKRIEEIRQKAREGKLDEVHPSHLMVLVSEIDRLEDRLNGLKGE